LPINQVTLSIQLIGRNINQWKCENEIWAALFGQQLAGLRLPEVQEDFNWRGDGLER
jgi:hypothetical protein